MKKQRVRRNYDFPCELRASGDGATLEGYAAVFNQETNLGYFKERVARGAFTKTLNERDQVALWDHETSKPLARKSAGTLELREDEHGLRVKMKLDPSISWHADAWASVARGDVQGMSFGFDIIRENYDKARGVWELQEVRLFEVSPCTIPAYEVTEVQARAIVASRGIDPDHGPTEAPDPSTDADHATAGTHRFKYITLLAKRQTQRMTELLRGATCKPAALAATGTPGVWDAHGESHETK